MTTGIGPYETPIPVDTDDNLATLKTEIIVSE